jgi:hypothetical protein
MLIVILLALVCVVLPCEGLIGSLRGIHLVKVAPPSRSTPIELGQNGDQTRQRQQHQRLYISMMSSVAPTPRPPPPPVPKAFIITGSDTSNSEMMILQNFNQIQMGERIRWGVIGSQELSNDHIQMIELLAYALVLSGNHIYTSGGAGGTNIAVIKGALRACNPDLLTVILPQSLMKQPSEVQPLLARVVNLVEQPEYDSYDFRTAAALCNEKIISSVDKVLCFAYHDSSTVLAAAEAAKGTKDVTTFFLD